MSPNFDSETPVVLTAVAGLLLLAVVVVVFVAAIVVFDWAEVEVVVVASAVVLEVEGELTVPVQDGEQYVSVVVVVEEPGVAGVVDDAAVGLA